MRRILGLVVVLGLALPFAPASATTCSPRLLVLSAMPSELAPLVARASDIQTVELDGRTAFTGSLRGNDVVLALTGIGLVNAERTTRAAFEQFTCGISGVVFSGVSGGRSNIGDVTIPARWTPNRGTDWYSVDAAMYATALGVKDAAAAQLARATPPGDIACVGVPGSLVGTVVVDTAPTIITGGDGGSSDPFGGRALPCIPRGGDVFGCQPCSAPGATATEIQRFPTGAAPFLNPQFFADYNDWQSSAPSGYDADDMETAAVARVAAEKGAPFIAFRALSDGAGDPLHLPGFPFQFFFYRQLAADNAATVALAFLGAWSSH